ncbi:MAG: DNA-processing protein DprA [Candidatus Delongbacteria bacterium]|jgi:DNA processing protein|nr:DNA-processing protein DprA [Candidatus Delongbacteria bacterium]
MPSKEQYQIAASMIPGIGPVSARNLIAAFGDIEALFKIKGTQLKRTGGVGKYFASTILTYRKAALERAEMELRFMEANDVNFVFLTDEAYPKKLFECADAPLILYYTGDLTVVNEKTVAVVGTRKATSRGRDTTGNIIKNLPDAGIKPAIVSGLAYGIDVTAHKEALENDLPTVAVFGHGFDIVYPVAHTKIAENIVNAGGVLVSEFHSTSKRDPKNFVRRNRIIAGLSDATIVVESARKGGAMVTADIANSYNRDVFAVPGRINDKYSRGCNHLIKTNRAMLMESTDDLLYIMNWKSDHKKTPGRQKQIEFNVQMTDNEKIIVDLLSEKEYCDTDVLTNLSGLNIADLSVALLNLEMKSIIKALPGKIYALNK